MSEKFPNKVVGKWNRFDKVEKGFILYCLVIIAMILFTPIIQINPIGGSSIQNYYFINKYLVGVDIIVIALLAFLLLWNISFRFKTFINMMVGFKDNDALVNFVILLVISISFMTISSIIQLLKNNFSNSISLSNQYYLIGTALIVGLIRNLILALNLSKNKRKGQIINIVNHNRNDEETDKIIKTLFDEDN